MSLLSLVGFVYRHDITSTTHLGIYTHLLSNLLLFSKYSLVTSLDWNAGSISSYIIELEINRSSFNGGHMPL